jgi:hypothetical protein
VITVDVSMAMPQRTRCLELQVIALLFVIQAERSGAVLGLDDSCSVMVGASCIVKMYGHYVSLSRSAVMGLCSCF